MHHSTVLILVDSIDCTYINGGTFNLKLRFSKIPLRTCFGRSISSEPRLPFPFKFSGPYTTFHNTSDILHMHPGSHSHSIDSYDKYIYLYLSSWRLQWAQKLQAKKSRVTADKALRGSPNCRQVRFNLL